ncbi:MAG: hypothetical protein K2N64_06100 [Anaeroplasmataceae bacterium]|nr:hypothetical protein [Anaeroplasmataceae bacterium]
MKKYKKKRCNSLLKLTGLFLSFGFLFSLIGCNKVEAVEEHSHTKVHVPKIEATCIKEGRMEYWYCTQCGKICSDRAMEHEITKEQTTLPKTEHTIIEEIHIDPTCETSGKTVGRICSYCDLVLEEQKELPALGHAYDYDNPVWVWNGFDEAEMIVSCKNDALHKLAYPALISSETIAPTCTEEGKTIYTASLFIDEQRFMNTKEEILLPTGHTFDLENISWEWENYSKAYVKIPCLHNEVHTLLCEAEIMTKTIDPACMTMGKIIHTAVVIIEGQTLTDEKEEILDALGHDYDLENISWEWNGVTSAKAWVECKNDSTHQTCLEATITSKRVQPTCERDGQVQYTATILFNGESFFTTKEEILVAIGHAYDYENVEWIWDGFDRASLQAICKNNSEHIESYDAELTFKDIVATCVHEGKRIYTATTQIKGTLYETQKEEVLPIDPNHHEYDYESLSWQWIPTVTSYEVIVKVYCGCKEHMSLSFEDIEVLSSFRDSTFEEKGYIQYEASIVLLGKTFTSTRTDILPIKQRVSTEEEFLAHISEDAFSLVLDQDITLMKSVLIQGSFAGIDLNTYSLTVLDTGISVEALKGFMKNGTLIAGVKNTLGSYGLNLQNSSNLLVENMVFFAGINVTDSKLFVRNSDITATFENALALKNAEVTIEEGQIYKCYAKDGLPYFFSLNEGSHLEINRDTRLYTTLDARLYLSDFEEDIEIQKIDELTYLTSNRPFKCMSLQNDLDCSYLRDDLTLDAKKLYLSLGNHSLLVPSGSLKITSSYAVLTEGSIDALESHENIMIIDQGAEVLLKSLMVYGNIRVLKSTLDLIEVSIRPWENK